MARAYPLIIVPLLLACTGYISGPIPCPGPDGSIDGSPDTSMNDTLGDGGDDHVMDRIVCVFFDHDAAFESRALGEDVFAPYVGEILAHGGIPHRNLDRDDLLNGLGRCTSLIIAEQTALAGDEIEAIEESVRRGGSVIALGGTSGLDDLLGVSLAGSMEEGYVEFIDSGEQLIPLHVFGGEGGTATTATAIARWLDVQGEHTSHVAVSQRSVEAGEAWFVGPDIARSVVMIQQGRPVFEDGVPAPDGTADLRDSILKADDGVVLDWVMDRSTVGGEPLYLEPIADLLKELLLGLVVRAADRAGVMIPLLWYWPGDLNAVGVLSHDSDGNSADQAWTLLSQVESLGIDTTWCFMRYPETIPIEVFSALGDAECEIALHYDARTPDNPETTWSEDRFMSQLAWLEATTGITVVTNKNHYTRWEGWVEFYRWCERAGLQADQSKGPSKRGNVGFLYGTAHPYFPIDDAEHGNRLIDVLAINLLSQDLVHTCPYEFGPALIDRALEHHGVAHFLFHPAHTGRPEIEAAMSDLVGYGTSVGLEWWTVEQVNIWERARRGVSIDQIGESGFRVTSESRLEEAVLLIPTSTGAVRTRSEGGPVECTPWSVYGVDVNRCTVDLEVGATWFNFE